MVMRKSVLLLGVITIAAGAAAGAWIVSRQVVSPSDAAARAAPPQPSPVLVPVEQRVLSSIVVTRGTARFGLPQPISIAPSTLKPTPGLIATVPRRNARLGEGSIVLTASGRPVFLLQGDLPAYRDLVPGVSGDDVLQLEKALRRLGFEVETVDRTYDHQTSAAVAAWYESAGWTPFGPTREQRARVMALERDWGDAKKISLSAAAAAGAAGLKVKSARAAMQRNVRAAEVELSARLSEKERLLLDRANGISLSVESARATAAYNDRAADAALAAQISEHKLVMLDPRQPRSARDLATARLELARSAVERTRLEGLQAIRAAQRDQKLAAERLTQLETAIESARAAVLSARRDGEIAIKSALDAREITAFESKLSADRLARITADLEAEKRKLGVQVPADEIVFLPELPVRVEKVGAAVGDPARGPVMSITDNKLMIDSSLTLDDAPLVKPGMRVEIDEQALGVKATGTVEMVAKTPGTHRLDGYHVYFEVGIDKTSSRLEGISLRLRIPIKSTKGSVTAVPISAVSLSADGKSRVQVKRNDAFEFVVVEPGLSADGYVEVTPVDGELAPGQLVVVGYDNPK